MKALQYLFNEILHAIFILVMVVAWPCAILILTRKSGLGGFILGMVLLLSYGFMWFRGSDSTKTKRGKRYNHG